MKLMRFRCDVRLDRRRTDQHRAAGMVLDPLTEVRIRVLVAILIRGGELVMNFQGRGKGGEGQKHQDHGQRHRGACCRESVAWQA